MPEKIISPYTYVLLQTKLCVWIKYFCSDMYIICLLSKYPKIYLFLFSIFITKNDNSVFLKVKYFFA